MKKYIFIFCMAALTAAPAMSSEPDTLRVYSIDGQLYRNFSGKELVGKTIKSYNIYYASDMGGSHVIESHRIKTTTPPAATNKNEPHYIIEGKKGELTKEEMNKISPSQIVAINVLKAGSKAISERSLKDDGRGYVIIKLKE